MKICLPRTAVTVRSKFASSLTALLTIVLACDPACAQFNPPQDEQAEQAAAEEAREASSAQAAQVPSQAADTDAAAEAPAPAAAMQATVTLPYAELKQLWQAAEAQRRAQDGKAAAIDPQNARPPVAALLRTADYQLKLAEAGRGLSLRAHFVAENLDTEWHSVPLLSGAFSLVETEPADALVVRRNDAYELLLPPQTRSELQLGFSASAALPRGWWAEHVLPEFHPAPASVRRLTLLGFAKPMRLLLGDSEWPMAADAKPSGAGRALPPEDGALDWRLTRIAPAESEQDRPDADVMPEPVPWQLRSEVFAAFDDGRLGFQWRVHAHTDAEQGGRVLHLTLPAGARGISAAGESLIRQRELARVKPTDPRRLELLWGDRDRAEREFTVEFELSQSPLATQWPIPLPRSEPPAESAALAVLRVNEGLEISADGIRSANASAGLPKWLAEAAVGGDFVSLEIADAARAVDIRWLPRVDTAPAVITEARATTRVVDDGALLNHAEYRIEHEGPLNWTLTLPDSSELLTASVNGIASRPIRRDDNTLELQIADPGSEQNRQSLVRITYAGKVEAFDAISGSVALDLPGTPLFVHRLLWDVAIPEGYETSAIDGNVATDSERAHCQLGDGEGGEEEKTDQPVIKLRKELIRNQAPAVEIFYRSILASS